MTGVAITDWPDRAIVIAKMAAQIGDAEISAQLNAYEDDWRESTSIELMIILTELGLTSMKSAVDVINSLKMKPISAHAYEGHVFDNLKTLIRVAEAGGRQCVPIIRATADYLFAFLKQTSGMTLELYFDCRRSRRAVLDRRS